jgi:Uma2 family endonuclease
VRVSLTIGLRLTVGDRAGGRSGLESEPDTVRAPDAAFVRTERIDDPDAPGFFVGPPDLAAEVTSPREPDEEVRAKVHDWLDAGCRMVVVVDADARTVAVHRPRDDVVVLGECDTLDSGDVVAGFTLPVAKLFAR